MSMRVTIIEENSWETSSAPWFKCVDLGSRNVTNSITVIEVVMVWEMRAVLAVKIDQMSCSKPSSVSVRTQGGKWSWLLGKYSPHISNTGDAQQRYIDKRISKQTSLLLFLWNREYYGDSDLGTRSDYFRITSEFSSSPSIPGTKNRWCQSEKRY